MMGLTPVQKQCLEFADGYNKANGVQPTYQEIAEHLGFSSRGRVCAIMDSLEERGCIRRVRNERQKARAWEIVPEQERRMVLVSDDVWPALVQYAISERVNIETAVRQFIRDGLEAA